MSQPHEAPHVECHQDSHLLRFVHRDHNFHLCAMNLQAITSSFFSENNLFRYFCYLSYPVHGIYYIVTDFEFCL